MIFQARQAIVLFYLSRIHKREGGREGFKFYPSDFSEEIGDTDLIYKVFGIMWKVN